MSDQSSGFDSLDDLMPEVYEELRQLAQAQLRYERRDHTLNTTALVHEAYMKMSAQRRVDWNNRAQFLGVASRAMRRILVDHARKRRALKRGGDKVVALDESGNVVAEARTEDLVALDEALERLASFDPRQSRVVECRFFGGLNIEETAAVLGVSSATVKREWAVARAWLYRELHAA
ncbi:MAG: sigma-70 family RNA polymerase sigma factor [Bacteroidota bacterium]